MSATSAKVRLLQKRIRMRRCPPPSAVQILQRAVPNLDDAGDGLTTRTDGYGLRIAEMKAELARLEARQEEVAMAELEEILEDWTVQEVGAAYTKHYFTEPKGKKA